MRTTPCLLRGLLALEARIAPVTDLILDFDGGTLQASQGYNFPPNLSSGGTNTYSSFVALPSTNSAAPPNRTEQILQIVAGVREDFADFNVAVFWDDRGVASPLFGAHDSVIMITNDTNNDDIGQTQGVDLGNTTRDVGIVYAQTIVSFPNGNPRKQIRTIVDTISRQAAYTFGISNAAEPDAEQRQIVGISVPQNQSVDSRFSTQALNHLAPEAGVVYAERDRLIQNVGAAVQGSQIAPNEAHTGQTLPGDTTLNAIDPALNSGFFPFDMIDYHGDRDAFRFTLPFSGQYTFRERATANLGNVDPVVTLWDADGNFLAAGSIGQANGVSAVNFTAVAGQTYYAVAGTGFDRIISDPANNVLNGANGALALGPYSIEITPSWAELNTQTREIVVTGDNSANNVTIDTVPGPAIRVHYGNESIEVPAATVLGVRVNTMGGDDNITIDLNGQLPPIAVDGGAGDDTLTVNGSDAAEIFAVQPALIGVQGGVPISLAGLENVTVNGAGGSDSFLVTPSPTTTFNCNGGAPTPPASPGDAIQPTDTNGTLTPNGTGAGEYDFPSAQPIIFTGMETIFPLPPGGNNQASLAGHVYVDANHNGLLDAGEVGISGVVLNLTGTTTGGTPVMRTATTAANGAYSFNLSAGSYALTETQPPGFLNGTARAGTAGGSVNGDTISGITLASGVAASGYDFGELTVGPPPPPTRPVAISFAIGAAAGTAPWARLFRTSLSTPNFQVFAYDQQFRGGVRVSTGDVTGDRVPDLVTAPGAGGGPDIRVFDGTTGRLVREFLAYVPNFTGGVYVAAADVDGDGIDDIVTGAGEGGGPHVKIFSGADGHLIREFMAYDANFRGGARVAARDVDGDGLADVVTGAGAGGSPLVNVFNGATGAVITAFFAYDPSFRGGVFVAAGDVTGDNHADIVTGAGEGGGAHVRVWDGAIGQPLRSFFPYTLPPEPFLVPPRTWTAGVRVALADVNGDGIDELVVAPGRGQTNPVRVLNYQTLAGEATIDVFFGGAYVG